MIVIGKETRDRLGTEKATYPKPNKDLNVGKIAKAYNGTYKGISGIIYPMEEGVMYAGSFDTHFTGVPSKPDAPYLLLMFYKSGSLFCGIPAELDDLDVVGGAVRPPVIEDGTVTYPKSCITSTKEVITPLIPFGKVYTEFFKFPKYSGEITIYMMNVKGPFNPSDFQLCNWNLYYADDLVNPLPKRQTDILTGWYYIDYNHTRGRNLVLIMKPRGSEGGKMYYNIHCPKLPIG